LVHVIFIVFALFLFDMIPHAGHFLLTNLLLDAMKKTTHESKREGRIVNVASCGHRFTYRGGICFDKINDESR